MLSDLGPRGGRLVDAVVGGGGAGFGHQEFSVGVAYRLHVGAGDTDIPLSALPSLVIGCAAPASS